jgi:hypothetical protein
VEEKEGKRILRAATPIPVVMKKCVMCHENYADAKAGEPIGLLSYSLQRVALPSRFAGSSWSPQKLW